MADIQESVSLIYDDLPESIKNSKTREEFIPEFLNKMSAALKQIRNSSYE